MINHSQEALFKFLEKRGVDTRLTKGGYFLVGQETYTAGVNVHVVERVRLDYSAGPLACHINFYWKDFYLAWLCLCDLIFDPFTYDPGYLVQVLGAPSFVLDERAFYASPLTRFIEETEAFKLLFSTCSTLKPLGGFCTICLQWSDTPLGLNAYAYSKQKLYYIIDPYHDDGYYFAIEMRRWELVLEGAAEALPQPVL